MFAREPLFRVSRFEGDETMLESLKVADPVESVQIGLSMEPMDTPQLPVEVWQKIAGHMSSRCWARLSRTCKTLYSVQPEQIDVCVSRQSAVAWVQTHWDQASSLKLTWMKSGIPWVMRPNAAGLSLLGRLELCLEEEKSPTAAMLLKRLLSQAPQLQLLSVQHPTALMVPPIRTLRHLIMASNKFTPASAASIRLLHNLQTLRLGTIKGLYASIVRADLDLASMPRLTDVCVVKVPMPKMTLPRHCRLHFVGDRKDSMRMDMCSLLAQHRHLKSINLHSAMFRAPRAFHDDLPDFHGILDCPLSHLQWWGIAQLGKPVSPVVFEARSFPCLTHLNLMGMDINIVLPHELPLQVLHLEARSLSVVCENVQQQGKRLQQLRVQYRTQSGADIFGLVGAMCGMGARVHMFPLVVMEKPGWIGQDRQHGFVVSYQHMPDSWKCPCGACLDCVRQSLEC